MVIHRSMNTVPIRLHIRLKRMDLQVARNVFFMVSYCTIPAVHNTAMMCKTLPVFMEQQNQQPDVTEDHSTCFSHGKSPWYSRHTV